MLDAVREVGKGSPNPLHRGTEKSYAKSIGQKRFGTTRWGFHTFQMHI